MGDVEFDCGFGDRTLVGKGNSGDNVECDDRARRMQQHGVTGTEWLVQVVPNSAFQGSGR